MVKIASNDYKEVDCPFCGRIIRDIDRFCIFCGKPIPTENKQTQPEIPQDERKELEESVNNDLVSTLKGKGDTEGSEDDEEKSIPFQSNVEEQGSGADGSQSTELPEEIKEQLEMKIELTQLDDKKKRLRAKIDEFNKSLQEDRYEWDALYAEEVNIKLQAFKELKNEISRREQNCREKLAGPFRLDELAESLKLKKEQLIELTRSYKRYKIKKDVYQQLKEEYLADYQGDKTELDRLTQGLVRLLSSENVEKNRLKTQMRLLEGRYNSKEMTKEDYDSELTAVKKTLVQINHRVEMIEKYTKQKKKGFF